MALIGLAVGLYVGGVFGPGTGVLVKLGVVGGAAWIEVSVLTLSICVASSRAEPPDDGRRLGALPLVFRADAG